MPTFGQNLKTDKAEGVAKANAMINAVRQAIATDIAFQDEAYKEKRDEAEAYLASQPATLEAFPLLESITVIRGMSAFDLAELWMTTNSDWVPALKTTEIIREKANVAIAAATNRAGVQAAIAQLQADIDAL
jgi:hypothetical protein